MHERRLIRVVRAIAVPMSMTAVVATFTQPLAAHVTIHPSEAPHGASLVLRFRVPNERATVETTRLVVQFPQTPSIASVQPLPVAGWTSRITMRHLASPVPGPAGSVSEAVDTVAWSGGTIRPHASLSFPVRAGPLPATGSILRFKALQYYSNGEVVRWIQTPLAGQPEPPNPAPSLRLIDSPAVTIPK